jgi:thiol-disulfide isomerase/thioredoxin
MKHLFISLMFSLAVSITAMAQNAAGSAIKLEGQIVCCADCWAKADRKTTPYGTAFDLEKAKECVANGDPSLLAVTDKDGATILYQLETGKFKRPGKNWLEDVGKHVEVTGQARSKKDTHYIKVDALTILSSPALAAAPEVDVIGSEAELVLEDLSGVEQRLSGYRGRIVVLNFWATYCVPCRKEMPDLAAIQNEYAALGVQVIGASADSAEEKAKVMRFIKETKLNFPVWLGATASDMQRFGLGSALPGTVIIGRDGKIVAGFRGVIKQADLKKQLETLLAAAEAQAEGQLAKAKRNPGKAASVPS